MLSDFLIAGALLLCLSAFFIVNAHNVVKGSRERRGAKAYAELERPSGVPIASPSSELWLSSPSLSYSSTWGFPISAPTKSPDHCS